jgi:2'-5' RNA ligase
VSPSRLRPDNRLFVAMDLPPRTRAALAQTGEELARDGEGRAVDERSLHVTLAFLGRVPPRLGPVLAGRLAALLPGPAVRLAVDAVVGRPDPARARLAAVGLRDPAGAGAAIASRVREAIADAGLPGPDRPFWPHVTVARFRRPTDVRRSRPALSEHVFDITRVCLYDSHIGPAGPPRYEALMEVALGDRLAERSSTHG